MLRISVGRLQTYGLLVVCLAAVSTGCGRSPLEPASANAAAYGGPASATAGSIMSPNRTPVPVASSIALNPPQVLRPDGIWPRLHDTVTFSTTYSSKLEHYGVRIQVMCSQGGQIVYGEAGPYDQPFLLGGGMSLWLMGGGEVDCQADLYYWSYQGGVQTFNPLASTKFHAYGAI